MKKFLFQIFTYLLITFLVGLSITGAADYFLSKSYFYKPQFISNYFSSASKLDYIIAGSSRGLTTIDTKEVDSKLGVKGFNISMDDTGLPSQFLMIKHFFESGNTANYCVLTLDVSHFEESEKKLNDNDYRFITYSDRSYVHEYYRAYETGIIRPLTWSKYFPLFAYSYYNMELIWPAGMAALKPRYKNRFDEKGDYSYPDMVFSNDSPPKVQEIQKAIKNPILEEIRAYLQTKNSELILYIAPYFNKSIYVTNPSNYPLINHAGALQGANYFFDIDHVNTLGKQEATNLFMEDFQAILKSN
ncbi:hypothetical protein [Algoriphagus limi]|uniref:DUF1574 domain-containing protein n=1 Tax=Algoriphagus limi TaxID=2975273 RepID=A0ABT2G1E3_9BACT|nr:hypothetical protein [Algoriphagus limi]MCS5488999.1 hypothetical protein [Algoriphagus limi]